MRASSVYRENPSQREFPTEITHKFIGLSHSGPAEWLLWRKSCRGGLLGIAAFSGLAR